MNLMWTDLALIENVSDHRIDPTLGHNTHPRLFTGFVEMGVALVEVPLTSPLFLWITTLRVRVTVANTHLHRYLPRRLKCQCQGQAEA